MDRKNRCILCTTTDGEFSSVEHIISESLGNKTLILPRGCVCDKCNNELSELEKKFLNTLPISLVRGFFGGVGKKGNRPKAKFTNLYLEQISWNTIKLMYHKVAKNKPKATKLPNGGWDLEFFFKNQHFKPHVIARVLFKMGLEFVALNRGREEALHHKYNAARKYILKGGHFPNRLVIFKIVSPSMVSRIYIYKLNKRREEFIYFNLLGAWFTICLESEPKIKINREFLDQAYVVNLWEDKPESIIGDTNGTE